MSDMRKDSWKEKQAWATLVGTRAAEALAQRNITAKFVATNEEAVEEARKFLTPGAKVGYGDSASLYESGILAMIKGGEYNVLEWDRPNTSYDEMKRIWREGFTADVFFTGVNAMTDSGIIVNLDSTGNRIAPVFFGPDKVVLLVGINKIVPTLEDAMARAHQASVINNIRWEMKTPCVKTGRCMDCQGKSRICAYTQIIETNGIPGRINVIIVGQSLGY